MDLLTERKICQNEDCGKPVVHLVNGRFCMKCYQADYYDRITKTKRKEKKRNSNKACWWMNYYV